jgi:Carboxypeptidase regulatory-like domain/TonB dependent receptor
MKFRFLAPKLLWLLAALMMSSTALFSQATDSTIVGTVTDATGAAVPNASVTAINKETGVKHTSVTNSTGEYRLNNVPVGRYDVSGTAQGFATATLANVELELNHTASVNLVLPVGSVSTSVEVNEAPALIDTSTAQLQSTFSTMQAVDLPSAGFSKVVNGAGIYNLSLLGAGVTSSGGVGQGTGPSVSGQRPEANSFNIDGVGNDDHYSTGPQIYVSNESIQQFNLVQNQFSAEYGAASGGVFNAIVKSGTNSLHGTIYEYMQNRDLNAVDAQEVHQGLRSNPRFDSNRFGATIGGPIKKDKLFYFGNYEYNPLGQAAAPGGAVSAPTAAGYSLLAGLSTINKTNLGVFQKFVPAAATANGTTKVLGTSIPIGDLSFASPSFFNSYDAVVAIDWNISQSDQVRGRFIYANTTGLDSNANLPVFFQSQPTVNHSGSISEFHNFSPTMENEIRISFSRNNASVGAGNFQFPGLAAFPNLSFDDLGLQLGPDPNTPSGSIENKFQIQENITKTWGRHTFKAGYNFLDVILSGFFVQRARGDYDYHNLEEYLVDSSPTGGDLSGVAGERSAGSSNVPFGFLQHALFFQDDFRVRPNLTLNLGVRYEYVTVPVGSRYQANSAIASVPGVISFNRPKSNPNEWSPRLGFAWSPGKDGVWSIRGGVARSFYNTYINLNQNASPPYFQTTLDVDPNNPTPGFLTGGGLKATLASGTPSVADARAAVASYTFDQTRPYALTGTIGVQRLLGKNYTVEARYVYTKGVHLWNQTRVNIIAPVTASNALPTYLTAPSASTLAGLTQTLGALKGIQRNVYAQYGLPNNITGYHPWGNSRYNGLQLQMNKRYSQNFSYILAYTWSHAFDDATATNFSTILSPRRAQDFQNLRAEWASSALDRRHRFTFTPIYDFKPFQNGNYLMKNVVGNWNVSFSYTMQSPEFATIQSGVDSNLNGDALDRSIINPSGAATVGSGVTAYNARSQSVVDLTSPACSGFKTLALCQNTIVAYVANNANARYVVAGVGARSTSGRNTFPMGRTNNVDLSLLKRLNFTERIKFEVGAQAFNLFNHSQFVGGYISDVNPFGTAAISRAFLVPDNAKFAQFDQYFPSNSRTMQLVGRITF